MIGNQVIQIFYDRNYQGSVCIPITTRWISRKLVSGNFARTPSSPSRVETPDNTADPSSSSAARSKRVARGQEAGDFLTKFLHEMRYVHANEMHGLD